MQINKELRHFYDKFHINSKFQKKIIDRNNFTYRDIIQVLDQYICCENGRVLDIGCGVGTLDFYLANKKYSVLGVDISKKVIDLCIRNSQLLGLNFNTTFKNLNFPEQNFDEKFDYIICSEVLEHLVDDKKALSCIFKLLKPNGVLIISVPSKNAPLYKIGYSDKFDRNVGHLRRYLPEDLVNLCTQSGFAVNEVVKTEGIVRNFLFLTPFFGIFIKVLNRVRLLSDIFTFFDKLSLRLFGESNIFVVVRKP